MTTIYFDHNDPRSPTYRKSQVERRRMRENGEDIIYTDFQSIERRYPGWQNSKDVMLNILNDAKVKPLSNISTKVLLQFIGLYHDKDVGENLSHINVERMLHICPSEYTDDLHQYLISVKNSIIRQFNEYVKHVAGDINSADIATLEEILRQADKERYLCKQPMITDTILHELGLIEFHDPTIYR